MKKLNAMGVISLLLTLLIISVIFILMMPTISNFSNFTGIGGSSLKQDDVENYVNNQVNEIMRLRQNR